MSTLHWQLEIDRCPHCSIAKPNLIQLWLHVTTDHKRGNPRSWATYVCGNCGGVVLASSRSGSARVENIYPQPHEVDAAIPSPAKEYLQQAINSLHSPAGAVMLTASSVDAMLKVKGYKDGSLNSRINQAAKDHLITAEMATWAHEVRLDANEQRHADAKAILPIPEDAEKCVGFAQALGMFLFVLPARVVARGVAKTQ